MLRMPSRGASPRTLAALAVFAVSGGAYALTMNRVVGFIDRGELAAVATTLGIAHPTGYPLLTLLGRVATLAWPARPVLALNALAALLVAAGAAALAVLADRTIEDRGARLSERARAALAGGAALLVASSPPWWQQANGFEAYPLHALLLPLVLLAWGAWTRAAERGGRDATRRAALFGYAYGLAFANHMTSVLIAPALLVDFVWRRQAWGTRLRQSGVALAAFALGLTPYAYLLLRAQLAPRFAWNDTRTLRAAFDHVTAREFRGWMFESADTFARQTAYLADLLPRAFAWLGLLAAIAGLAWSINHRPRRGIFMLLLFLAGAAYACGYGIRDIDAYFLTSILAMGLLAAHGFAWLAERTSSRVAISLLSAVVLANGVLQARACNESRMTLADDFVTHQIGPLPPRAVLITTEWDFGLSASYYRQAVEGFRTDVTVIDAHLLENAWYVRELARRDPPLVAPVRSEMERFLEAVRPFAEHRPYDPARIMATYAPFAENLVREAQDSGRRVYVTREIGAPFVMGIARIPEGLAYRLTRDTTYVPCPLPDWHVRRWMQRLDASVAGTYGLYAGAFGTRARYEALQGHPDRARAWLDLALSLDPHLDPARLPPQPLDGRELILDVASRFASLRQARGALGP